MTLNFSKTEDLQNKIQVAAKAINSFHEWLKPYSCLKKLEDGKIVETGEKILMFDKYNPSVSIKGHENIHNYLLSIIRSLQNNPVTEIENEFINNLTDYGTESISNLTHIYTCKWIGFLPESTITFGSLHDEVNLWLQDILQNAKESNLLDDLEIDIILGNIEFIGELLNQVATDLQKLFVKFQPQNQPIENNTTTTSNYTIENKTDFIKIISAMYDCRMFKTRDGKIASNKKELIKTLGEFFNIEINDYSKLLSAAKNTNNYLEIFDKLKQKGDDYYKKQ